MHQSFEQQMEKIEKEKTREHVDCNRTKQNRGTTRDTAGLTSLEQTPLLYSAHKMPAEKFETMTT